eukprot:8469923-Alexandrium_andersonii.AAC.1
MLAGSPLPLPWAWRPRRLRSSCRCHRTGCSPTSRRRRAAPIGPAPSSEAPCGRWKAPLPEPA